MRWQSSATFLEYPVISIALGPDPENNEKRGHARGIIAIGDMASGVIALGALSRGVIALGGLTVGIIALGGGGIGILSFAGLALGYMGGATFGKFVIGPMQRDPQAVAFFSKMANQFLNLAK